MKGSGLIFGRCYKAKKATAGSVSSLCVIIEVKWKVLRVYSRMWDRPGCTDKASRETVEEREGPERNSNLTSSILDQASLICIFRFSSNPTSQLKVSFQARIVQTCNDFAGSPGQFSPARTSIAQISLEKGILSFIL